MGRALIMELEPKQWDWLTKNAELTPRMGTRNSDESVETLTCHSHQRSETLQKLRRAAKYSHRA